MSELALRHVRPNEAQLAQRQRDLRWQRRLGNVQRWITPNRPARELVGQLKMAGELGFGAHAPLATLDACGFKYPQLRVQVKSLKRQLADWIVVAKPGRRDAAELGALPAFNSIDYFIVQGRWRPLLLKHVAAGVELEAQELYEQGFAYQKTDSYQTLLERVESATAVRRQGHLISSQAELDAYFERFCALFLSIERHGMLSPEQVNKRGLKTNLDRPLGVAMGTKGKLHRVQGGNHRWAIAKVLGIETLDVELRMVHPGAADQVLELLSGS